MRVSVRHFQRFGLVPAVALLFFGGCTSIHLPIKDYLYQEVYYLTTRAAETSDNPGKVFRGNRGDPVHGVAMIAMDPDKRITAYARPGMNRELDQDALEELGSVQQIRNLSAGGFLKSLLKYREPGSAPEVLIYIHGYKQSFTATMEDAALLRYELAFEGPVIAFAWPSRNEVSGYMADLENVEWSEPQFLELIEFLAAGIPGIRIHIMAHSMGNRLLLRSLPDLAKQLGTAGPWPIGEVVMAAPDLDRGTFIEQSARALEAIPSRITLYVSARDVPLMTSSTVHKNPRLGDARAGVPVLPGIETIDVSEAISMTSGHDYYEKNRETLEDMHFLICHGLPAGERPTLLEVGTDAGSYWKLLPTERQENTP